MTGLAALAVSGIALIVAGMALDRAVGFSRQIHTHAWGMWEECRQSRDCFGCGERQVRAVTT